MRFIIQHHTHYRYSRNIKLGPQLLRFAPQVSELQRLIDYQIQIFPLPSGSNEYTDSEGNQARQVWFDALTDYFNIQLTMTVDTHQRYMPDEKQSSLAQLALPMLYTLDHEYVQGYLLRVHASDNVTIFSAELRREANHQALAFLHLLNKKLHSEFRQVHRMSGPPQTPSLTLQTRQGACRDLAVLFIDCCRAEGIAARFVSGYQKGNPLSQQRDLHAWPEAFLPGLGWCAYDPTHGELVSDAHVTISAAAHPENTMPVTGVFDAQGTSSSLDYQINILVNA